jgi:hypothetical protein
MNERGLFEFDALLNEHLISARQRREVLSCERRLMLAVLQNALDYYQRYIFAVDREGRELFEEAALWIGCTDRAGLYSFENISETLDINPEYLRRGLALWHRRLVEEHSRDVASSAPELGPVQAAG